MLTTTKVVVSKTSAQPSETIEVEWFIGLDVRWTPNADDELRLTTGSGVLVSRCPFLHAYTDDCTDAYRIDLCHAKGKLVCPPVPGGYVIALYDRTANRRVLTMPFRIEGPTFVPPTILSLEFPHTRVKQRTIPITPLGRVTVSFPPAYFQQYAHHTNHVIGIIAPHKGDNDGGQARGIYDSYDSVVKVPHTCVEHATFAMTTLDNWGINATDGNEAGSPTGGGGARNSTGSNSLSNATSRQPSRQVSTALTAGRPSAAFGVVAGGGGGGGNKRAPANRGANGLRAGFLDDSSDDESATSSAGGPLNNTTNTKGAGGGGYEKGYYSNFYVYDEDDADNPLAASRRDNVLLGGSAHRVRRTPSAGRNAGGVVGGAVGRTASGISGRIAAVGGGLTLTLHEPADPLAETVGGTGRTRAYGSIGNTLPTSTSNDYDSDVGSPNGGPRRSSGLLGASNSTAAGGMGGSDLGGSQSLTPTRLSAGSRSPATPQTGAGWLFSGKQRGSTANDGLVSTPISAIARRYSNQPSQFIEDDVTMSLMLPSEPGQYQVRYLTTPPSGVPFTVAVSEPFTVERPPGVSGEAATAAEWQQCDIVADVGCDRTTACVNERVKVHFNITSNSGRRLTPLDCIVFYPFGRSEQTEHNEGMYNAIGEALYEGSLEVPAPPNEGYYQVGYYSFHAQHVVAVGEVALSVRLPVAKLSLQAGLREGVKATSKPVYHIDCGDTVSFTFEVEDHIFSKQDQIVVLDEMANRVATAPMQTLVYSEPQRRLTSGKKAEMVRLVTGTAEVTIPMPGKYSVHYYSVVRKCPIAQLHGYIQLRPAFGGVPLPFAAIRAVGVLPMNEPIAVAVMKEGHDGRPDEEASQDCLVLYDEEQRDAIVAPSPDHPSSCPGIYMHYLRGNSYEHFTIPSLTSLVEARESGFSSGSEAHHSEGRRVVLRYMAALPGHYSRVCTSEAIITLRDPAQMVGFVRQQLKYVAVHDLAMNSHRFSPDGKIAAPIARPTKNLLASSYCTGGGGAGGPSLVNGGPNDQRQLVLATTLNGDLMMAQRSRNKSRVGTLTGMMGDGMGVGRMSRAGLLGSGGLTTAGGAGGSMAGTFLSFHLQGTEFKGAIMGPREATTAEAIRVVYHITDGSPRGADRIVLFSRDGCRTISDSLVEYAVTCAAASGGGASATTADGVLKMGELLLNPPTAEGTYVVGYYSDRHQGVVLISIPFMVSASPDTFTNAGMGEFGAIAQHRRAKAEEEGLLTPTDASILNDALIGAPTTTLLTAVSGRNVTLSPSRLLSGPRPAAVNDSNSQNYSPLSITGGRPTSAEALALVGGSPVNTGPTSPTYGRSRTGSATNLGGTTRRGSASALRRRSRTHSMTMGSVGGLLGMGSDGKRLPRTRVLIVAVGSTHLDKELKGPLNDIELFRDAATAFFFNGSRSQSQRGIAVLNEGMDDAPETIPTAHNIRKGIRWLLEDSAPGDQLVFYYSGCGTVIDGDNAILPCNYDAVSRYITYKELHHTLLAAAPVGCAVTVLIDASYWGSLRDKAMQLQQAPPESVAAAAFRRRRNNVGIAADSPWRSVALPPSAPGVIHPLVTEVSLGTLDGLGYFLPERFNPVVSMTIDAEDGSEYDCANGGGGGGGQSKLQSYHSFGSGVFTRSAATVLNGGVVPAGEGKHRMIMEASSGSYYRPEGAWDAFNRHTGRTVGVFTCSLCQVLMELAPRAYEVKWWEVYERVVREVAKSPYPQVPRVIVQASESLDRVAHAAGV